MRRESLCGYAWAFPSRVCPTSIILSLLCTDSNTKRLPRLLRNLNRLGIDIAETEEFDWTQAAPTKWHKHFDAILLDVPCSNTGVLRKRVDARWRMTPESITEVLQLG